MGYDLHITRAGWDLYSREHPISREEWRAAAESWPGMVREGWIDYADTGPVTVYQLHDGGDHPASLYWRHGGITVRATYSDTGAIARLAEHLGARLIGQDGEEYLTDGAVVDGDANQRPPSFIRPLYVNEVAAAWWSLLSREECEDDGSVAAQMLRAFTALAMREVATSDVPDADLLLFRCAEQWYEGEPLFFLTMARQFARSDEVGGDIVRVVCEARYRLTPPLKEIRTFGQWRQAGEPEERRAWLAEIAGRPEWAALDLAVPDALTLCGEPFSSGQITQQRELRRRQHSAGRPAGPGGP